MAGFEDDFGSEDLVSKLNFDFRGFLFKILKNWFFILISIGIGICIAYYFNVRKQNIYRLNALVSVETEQNPFFTSNTSISFNWGGVTGKTDKVMTTLATRRHNELVVDSLQFYKQYLQQGEYHLLDIYKNSPFEVNIDKKQFQMLGKPIEIKSIDDYNFELVYNFQELTSVKGQRFSDRIVKTIKVSPGVFKQKFAYGETVSLPFFNGVVTKREGRNAYTSKQYFINFLNFDALVSGFQNSVKVSFFKGSSTVLTLAQSGYNKSKIVDYLNATVEILRDTELRTKNLYATNTIAFIDSTLGNVSNTINDVNKELNKFRSSNKVFNVPDDISNTSEQLKQYEADRQFERTKINYLNNLENYLQTKTDLSKIAAPSSVGIDESGLLNSISKLNALATQRQNQEKTAREGSILIRRLDAQIDTEKAIAFELISAARRGINLQLSSLNGMIGDLRGKLKKLPQEQQDFLKIQRKLDISQEAYNVYQAKKSEAEIVKAANISDITMIDPAKDVGNGPIGPKKSLNYATAFMFG
ncbi:MAG: sugar transporter, partial [Winogradskyella sp.]